MNISRFSQIAVLSLLAASLAHAHDDAAEGKGVLGKVSFANTCDAKVQAQLERGVAMLHSFWYSAAEDTFREVLAQDPSCAIAGWGIASILMNNPLGGIGAAPKDVPKAQTAIDDARKAGARSQRERDYIDAVAAYYDGFDSKSERARQEARSKAYVGLAAKYPDDDEAQIFNALYMAGTQARYIRHKRYLIFRGVGGPRQIRRIRAEIHAVDVTEAFADFPGQIVVAIDQRHLVEDALDACRKRRIVRMRGGKRCAICRERACDCNELSGTSRDRCTA